MTRLSILIPAALLTACASSITPNYDARFGDAVRQARQRMIINPTAGSNPDPVAGIDGRASRETMIRYQESFQKPPVPTPIINIGGGIGSGGGQ